MIGFSMMTERVNLKRFISNKYMDIRIQNKNSDNTTSNKCISKCCGNSSCEWDLIIKQGIAGIICFCIGAYLGYIIKI